MQLGFIKFYVKMKESVPLGVPTLGAPLDPPLISGSTNGCVLVRFNGLELLVLKNFNNVKQVTFFGVLMHPINLALR